MPNARRSCKQCGRSIRSDSTRAIFLYLTPDDREVWLCGQGCLRAYNGAEAPDEVRTYAAIFNGNPHRVTIPED